MERSLFSGHGGARRADARKLRRLARPAAESGDCKIWQRRRGTTRLVSGCVVVIPLRSPITIHNGPCHQFTERRFAISLGVSVEARAPNRLVTKLTTAAISGSE